MFDNVERSRASHGKRGIRFIRRSGPDGSAGDELGVYVPALSVLQQVRWSLADECRRWFEADGSREFHPQDRSGAKSMCDLLLDLKPGQVICGFIGEPEKQKLRAAGIDVRVGSCSCSVDELVASFSGLPEA